MNPTETVILCEGFHDRAFWAGWLLSRECRNLSIRPGREGRIEVRDPFGQPVVKGAYGYETPAGHFVRVRPCHGKDNILEAARTRLKQRVKERLTRLVVNVDDDSDIAGSPAQKTGPQTADIMTLACGFDPHAVEDANGDILLDGGTTQISLIRWGTDDAPTPGVPDKQTLERLVCASIVAAYPERGENVQTWLDTRHEPPEFSIKEYSWSLMAGWRADGGCDDFLRSLWDDDAIAAELKTRLEVSGAWRIVEDIIA